MQETSTYLKKAKALIDQVKGKPLSVEERRELSIELATLMLGETRRIQKGAEQRLQHEINQMMRDPRGKAFAIAMTDQCFRSHNNQRVANQLHYLIHSYGIPQFLNMKKKLQLKGFQWIGDRAAALLVPTIKRLLRKETEGIILPQEPKQLQKHILQRRKEDVDINLNHLGEAVLGEEEAERRLQGYLEYLTKPDVSCISVKISTICSQLHLAAWEETLERLVPRLKALYRQAMRHKYLKMNGQPVEKLVNLDMEEYCDLHLTLELFRRVLDAPEFHHHTAGIVLQSYLPDSYLLQQELTIWAMQRVASGGAPIRMRLVKGANLAMEQVEASLHNWPQTPYDNKSSVDANFKRMLTYACKQEHAQAIHVGIGSHNLFDIAYALLLRAENEVIEEVQFEMLEGMAGPMSRVVQKLANQLLLYCPTATQTSFNNAIAYLIRRLDENTAPQNFLRHAFSLIPGTKEWQNQANLFSISCHTAKELSKAPNRQQNRFTETEMTTLQASYAHEAETDFSLPFNRRFARDIVTTWQEKTFEIIPLVIDGEEIETEKKIDAYSPSNPSTPLYTHCVGREEEKERALNAAKESEENWQNISVKERTELLLAIAHEMRNARSTLTGAMMADTGKTVEEADSEICEAVDFAEYYARSAIKWHSTPHIDWKAKGTLLICPPWNFPLSIPAGSLLSALVTGNCVLFKPAPEAVLVGWELIKLFWKSGISKKVLQFFPCQEEPTATSLVKDPRINAVMLTGATETAKHLLNLRPGLDLIAETGGKNSLIITSLADRDLAISDLIHSAFGHAGQKCSACSLGILEAEVYEDPHFRQQLKDAAASLPVGLPWRLDTVINPLIHEPNSTLMRGLTTLEEGEEWLLKPVQCADNHNLWSPGIKLGVQEGGFTHQTELFGPVLGLMKAKDLTHAIKLANATPYGLTSGLHSLDSREQQIWQNTIHAGNLYINRTITGAIVERQPFGGTKESCYGKGYKAGGPNTLLQLMTPIETAPPKEKGAVCDTLATLTEELKQFALDADARQLWRESIANYAYYFEHTFSKKVDPSQILGQHNFLCYVPRRTITLRLQQEDLLINSLRVLAAALICKTPFEISGEEEQLNKLKAIPTLANSNNFSLIAETEEAFIQRVSEKKVRRTRFLTQPSEKTLHALAQASCLYLLAPVLANGRLELLNYLREVAISHNHHRYGHIANES